MTWAKQNSKTMQTTLENTTQAQPVKTQVELGEFGNGRYSPIMEELFRDTQRLLQFTETQAHATSARLGIDLGRLQVAKVKGIAYGKSVNNDGFRSIREMTQAVKVKDSWAIAIAFICAGLDALRKQGLECESNSIDELKLQSVNEAASRLEAKAKQ